MLGFKTGKHVTLHYMASRGRARAHHPTSRRIPKLVILSNHVHVPLTRLLNPENMQDTSGTIL